MCIRDSNKGEDEYNNELSVKRAQAVMSYMSTKGIDRGRMTVSYTHLRAHETVLDLVCRLLLEKKKKYNIKSKTMQKKLTYKQLRVSI